MEQQSSEPVDGPPVDGRRARGRRRRSEIIEATLRVIERDGADGVTHRTVAREAGVPTSLSTYYFATLDDLLVAALSTVADEYTDELSKLSEQGDQDIAGLAAIIANSGGTGRKRALAERELSTLAARRPALRPMARTWRVAVADIARRRTSDQVAVDAFVAAADGLCTAILIEGADPDPQAIRSVLLRILGRSEPAG
jgi:TetR/AcrR family transcriptional regulator, regulator of biofilm formation and stress response